MRSALEAALRRQRALTVAALAVLTLLAWAWLLAGAGMGMAPSAALWLRAPAAMDMTMDGMAMTASARAVGWTVGQFLLAFSMWWVMMVAMMLPAAAPVVLLHARVSSGREAASIQPSAAFVLGYLLVWGVFSLHAAAAQGLLEQSGILSAATMGPAARLFPSAVLLAAGLYQLSPLKEACLAHCRNPAAFLSRHYRPGRSGAVRLGVLHGAFCLGCCWLLMALLFAVGVMNLIWIALLTLLVAAEKLLPGGRRLAQAAGAGFIVLAAVAAFA
jgi:predicted metal-binding membrane protein